MERLAAHYQILVAHLRERLEHSDDDHGIGVVDTVLLVAGFTIAAAFVVEIVRGRVTYWVNQIK